MNFDLPKPVREPENKNEQITISPISPESTDDISAYYQFEVDQGFSQVNPKTTFDKMVDFRQQQIKENKLKVAMAKEGDQIVATTVVILENGTMGKQIKDDEAWAAGTVVLPEKRGSGIGEKMAEAQDKIAREAGKKSILTAITNNNYPSMRLRLKVGYHLEGIDQRKNETNYKYRKNLAAESPKDNNWKGMVEAGELKIFEGELNDSSPSEILIDPGNVKQIQNALNNNYEGVYLLRPEDFEEPGQINNNLVVFVKK